MRISTKYLNEQGINAIRAFQDAVGATQSRIALGRDILDASDDPAGSARLVEVSYQIGATRQFNKAITLAGGRLALEETTLNGAGNILQRARELAVYGGNDSLGPADRQALAREIRELRGQLLQQANAKDGNNEYLFGGYKSGTAPFSDNGDGSVSYNGDNGQRLLQVGPTRNVAVSDSGDEVFRRIRTGNGSFVTAAAGNRGGGVIRVGSVVDAVAYATPQLESYTIKFTAPDKYDVIGSVSGAIVSGANFAPGQALKFRGMEITLDGQPHGDPATGDTFSVAPAPYQDMFTTLERLAGALESPLSAPADSARLQAGLGQGIAGIDLALEKISEMRGKIGARMNALDQQADVNGEFDLRMQQIAKDIDGFDYAEAASDLSSQLLALSAAQQSFVKIQNLSLFNYMR